MTKPQEIYDLLLDSASSAATLQEVLIGLTWTLCQVEHQQTEALGLCMSPGIATRTLPWSGTLATHPVQQFVPWVRSWNAHEATVGLAAINAVINLQNPLSAQAQPLSLEGSANLAVFEHFLPQIRGKRVAVIGRYPGLSRYQQAVTMTVIERQPGEMDLPDPASEYLLPEAEWVFLTATSIANKTFPRLAELAHQANLVLMGPTVPWLADLAQFGVDYLAGVTVTSPDRLRQTVAEGGGVRIFETGVQYRVLKL
ncbi:MAG: DUF364 domain-containing protein [Oscillatoriales cyanobacterium RM1_1_9]|nr:DUF364 domain-containing protein [Oscillatoriales cyanobacterium SM2_3_0]NJO47878.1 DUF364 domain-containing protein [Oscillatoriales cyanobacterium RM2_1_1]NJO72165.1 DUF364 domain-containing protein [Oscillatoriales cyanobacterium RM1_1_9]